MHGMEERTVTRTTPTYDRRRGLLPMIIAAAVGFLCGWGLGDVGDSGTDHGLPGGPATDGVRGNSGSDRVGTD
jgi:hypothetical protein